MTFDTRQHSPSLHRLAETRSVVPVVVTAAAITTGIVMSVGLLLWPSADEGAVVQQGPDLSQPSASNPLAAPADSQVDADDGGNPPQASAPKSKATPNRRLSVPASAPAKPPADRAEQYDPAITLAALRNPGVAFSYDPTTKRLAVAEREGGELSFL